MERSPMLIDGRIYIVKMAILIKAIYMINAIPMKIPKTYVTKIEKVPFSSLGSQGDIE
jgi:hypothetical protein